MIVLGAGEGWKPCHKRIFGTLYHLQVWTILCICDDYDHDHNDYHVDLNHHHDGGDDENDDNDTHQTWSFL